jgi:sigma54-dependent transcription regulator
MDQSGDGRPEGATLSPRRALDQTFIPVKGDRRPLRVGMQGEAQSSAVELDRSRFRADSPAARELGALTMPRAITDLRLEELTSGNALMRRCLRLASFAAKSDAPVLILGRTGTGKTLLAHAIHNSSHRSLGPFVSFNASAMSDTLLESELFGHERGAFTGALQVHRGKFEIAHSGTLFLDEIADMSPLAQAKILRAVEYGEFERVGGERIYRSNARIISATNSSLRERIATGKFREDLYHRLDGLVLLIPPCERVEDLPSDRHGLEAATLRSANPLPHSSSGHGDAAPTRLAWQPARTVSHDARGALFCEGRSCAPSISRSTVTSNRKFPRMAENAARAQRPAIFR